MNKRDVLILVALFGLWLLWAPIDRHFIKPVFFPDPPVPEAVDMDEVPEARPEVTELEPRVVEAVPAPVEEPSLRAPTEEEQIPQAVPDVVETTEEDEVPAKELILETERMTARFSSRGGTIAEVILHEYPEFNEPDSGPVRLDFGEIPSLAILGLSGLSPRFNFDMELLDTGHGVRFTTELPYGLRFQRIIEIADDYLFNVSDTFINTTESPLLLPGYGLRTGRMTAVPGVSSTYGMFPLGVDTLSPAESVTRWAKDIQNRWIRGATSPVVRQPLNRPVDWVAVKNKYFVQILRPRSLDTENSVVYIEVDLTENQPEAVWATLQFPSATLDAGGVFTRDVVFFAGPQQLRRLQELGFHQDQIMELGWRPIRFFASTLMWGLAGLYGIFGNYGVAIMLLTVIIRIFFWPLTHKGTESMRRMQEIAPLMKELNEKYKDDAQKRQQAMMQLYKEHKVNPLGGCLPMLVQIPVFIGLFYLLRTAIELRYAGFLWIDDLSEPEGILGDVLPLPINILPIFMAVTMFFQQKLTPTAAAGNEQQQQMQKMMMRVMPVMMLVLLYNFASGLALYWSTQNVLMIVQQVLYRRRLARRKAAEQTQAVPTPAIAPTPKKKRKR